MAKFIYRMQNILNIKYKLEEQAKMEFAAANAHLREEEERLLALQQRQEAYEEEAKRLLKDRLDVNQIRENKEAILRMEEFQKEQQLRVAEAERQVELASEKLAGLMQERKAQEKLKEKAFASFMQDENAKESKEIDELVSFTYGKKQREEQ